MEGLGEVPSVIAANQVIADAEADFDKKLKFGLKSRIASRQLNAPQFRVRLRNH